MRASGASAVVIIAALFGIAPRADRVEAVELELRLTVEKATYAPYEPVAVQYALYNPSDAPQTYPGDVGPQSDWIKIEVGSGTYHPYRTGPIVCRFVQDRTLSPHTSLRAQVLMISNQYAKVAGTTEVPTTPAFPFGSIGDYEIRARYPKGTDDQEEAFLSNVVKVTVREPTEREKLALVFFESPSELSVAMGGEVVDTKSAAERPDADASIVQWESFVQAFGDTPYAPFVRLHLARAYRDDARLAVRRPDVALSHLKEVVKTGPRAIVDDAMLELAKAAIDDNRIEEAQRVVVEFVGMFPDSEHVGDAKRIGNGLKAGYRTLKDIYSH